MSVGALCRVINGVVVFSSFGAGTAHIWQGKEKICSCESPYMNKMYERNLPEYLANDLLIDAQTSIR